MGTDWIIGKVEELSKEINIPLNSIFNSCIELRNGINRSTLNQLEKAGVTKIINDICGNYESIYNIRQNIHNIVRSNPEE